MDKGMKKVATVGFAAIAVACCASSVSAGFVELVVDGGWMNGKFVCRLYAQFDSANDVVLSVFGVQGLGQSSWNQSDFVGGSWSPAFTSDPVVDSYVTIGGSPGFSNTTAVGASWGAPGFNQPGIPNGAGWFNPVAPNLQGKVDPVTLRTLLAQFVYPGLPTQSYVSPLTVSFNQGLGTPIQFTSGASFALHIPAPGAFSLAAATMLVGSRRRHPR